MYFPGDFLIKIRMFKINVGLEKTNFEQYLVLSRAVNPKVEMSDMKYRSKKTYPKTFFLAPLHCGGITRQFFGKEC